MVNNQNKLKRFRLPVCWILFIVLLFSIDFNVSAEVMNPEPGSAAIENSTELKVLSESWDEDITQRYGTRRAWTVAKDLERKDPVSGQISVEKHVSNVIQVGNGLCYKDETGTWQAAEPQWQESPDGFVLKNAAYSLSVGSTVDTWLTYSSNGQSIQFRPEKIVARDDKGVRVLCKISGKVKGRINSDDTSRLVFSSAFGKGIDVEIQASPGGYHQNVIFQDKSVLEKSGALESSEILVCTEVNPGAEVADEDMDIILSDRERFAFKELAKTSITREEICFVKKDKTTGIGQNGRICSIAESLVMDAGNEAKQQQKTASKQIIRNPKTKGIFLIESLDASFFKKAVFPVVWDYQLISVSTNITSDEIWHASNVYQLTDNVTVDGATLRIEPGTEVRIDAYKQLRVSNGGKIIARGKPHRKIIFKKSGSYSHYGVKIGDDSEFEFCSILGGYTGLTVIGLPNIPIQHNYFSDNTTSIYVGSNAFSQTLTIFNNLIIADPCSADPCDIGILLNDPCDIYNYISIRSNTFVNIGNGIYNAGYNYPSGYQYAYIYNNIFAGCYRGVYTRTYNNVYIDHTGWYDNDYEVFYDIYPYYSVGYGSSATWAESYPFCNGYYLNDAYHGGPEFVDAGYGAPDSSYGFDNPLEWATRHLSTEDSSRYFTSSASVSGTWEPQYDTCDNNNTIDLGYHHPRIDYIIRGVNLTVNSGATLTVKPGTIISHQVYSYSGSGLLSIQDGGKFECIGDPNNNDYITWVDYYRATQAGVTQGLQYNTKDYIICNSGSVYDVRFTHFTGLGRAFNPNGAEGTVHNCIFSLNTRGLDFRYCNGHVCTNSLFYGNALALRDLDSEGGWIVNCTFDGNGHSLNVAGSSSTANVAIRNCIFTEFEYGIRQNNLSASIMESHNAFYSTITGHRDYCSYNGSFTNLTLDDDDQSLSSSPYDTGFTDFSDKFRLNSSTDCIDNGFDPFETGMPGHTTLLNDNVDASPTDIGYHYMLQGDTDGDGLEDFEEYWFGFDKDLEDTNEDWLYDFDEYTAAENIYFLDSDGDGVNNLMEVARGTDPQGSDFPFTTSFESVQGFSTNGIGQYDGWDVDAGSGTVTTASSYYDDENWTYYQYLNVGTSSEVSRQFNYFEDPDQYIKISSIPSSGSIIKVMDGDNIVAGVKFDSTDVIKVYHSGSWVSTGVSYQSLVNTRRGYLSPASPDHLYDNIWIPLEIHLDWANGNYEVNWNESALSISGPVTEFLFDESYTNCTEIVFDNDSTGTTLMVNRISVSDESTTGGEFGPNGDVWITSPVADINNPLKGSCLIKGSVWHESMSQYKIKYCPADTDDIDDESRWLSVAEGTDVRKNSILGKWDMANYRNGDYHLKFEIYDDIGRLINLDPLDGYPDPNGIIYKELSYTDDQSNEYNPKAPVAYPIIGRGAPMSYSYQEKPDITIDWPGTFPFEFKRTYSDSLNNQLYPLFFGWTHNHNIRIMENCSFDWITNGDNPETDGNGLGIGRLWLLREAGGRMFEYDSKDQGQVTYKPVDNENDYIIRTATANGSSFTVSYTHYASDGMQLQFNSITVTPGSASGQHPSGYTPATGQGAVDWKVIKGVDQQLDRFGNALIYTWEATAEKYITKIENNRTDAELIFQHTMDDVSSILGGIDDLCEQVLLSDGTNSEPVMQFSFQIYSLNYITKKRTETTTSVAWTNATNYMYEVRDNSLVVDTIYLPTVADGLSSSSYMNETSPEIRIDRYSNGSLKEVIKTIAPGTHRNYYFGYRDQLRFVESYSYQYDEDNNMTKKIKYEIDTDYGDDVLVRTNKTTFTPDGATICQTNVTSETQLDPYSYSDQGPFWCGSGGAESWSTGGGGVRDVEYVYGDSRFPFKPTIVIESVDDEGTGAAQADPGLYESIRKTTYEYDERGNTIKKRVYVDEDNFIYTVYDYHQEYNLQIEKATWTGYCYNDGQSVVTSGKAVVSKWLYDDDPDGTPGTGDSGDYLVQEEVLLDDMGTPANPNDDEWAITQYIYNVYGQVINKTDPEQKITFFEYDSNGFVQRVWLDATLSAGLPVGPPQKRRYTNAIGFLELEGDNAGKVMMYLLDDCGRTVESRTYFDDIAMERPTEAEYLGSGDLPFEPDTYSGLTVQTNVLYSSYNSYDKPELVKMPKYYDGQQEWQRAEIEKNYFIGGQEVAYLQYDGDGTVDTFWTGYHFSFDPLPMIQVSYLDDSYQDSNKYYVYDAMNRLCHEYEYNYNPGYASQHPNPFIKHTVYEYYGSGQKSSKAVYKVLRTSSTVFDDQLEKYVTYEYDILDRLIKQVVYASGTGSGDTCTVTEYVYDALGNKTCVITYEGNVTNPDTDVVFTDYDNAGRKVVKYFAEEPVYITGTDTIDITATKSNAVSRTSVSYNLNGKATGIVSYDHDGTTSLAEKSITYDGRGRVTSVTEAISSGSDAVTYYNYRDEADSNLAGQPESGLHIKITDGRNKVTWIGLTPHKKIAKVIYPSGDYEEIQYYGHGLIKQKRVWDGAIGLWIEYEYDEFGKLARMDYPSTGGYLTYEYTTRLLGELGEVKSISDYRHADDRPGTSGSTYEFEYYNYSGNLMSYENQNGYTVMYDYNTAYNLKTNVTVTDSTPAVIYSVDYTYDLAGRLTEVIDSSGATDQYIAGLEYDYNGNRMDLDYYLEGSTSGDTYNIDYDYTIDNFLYYIDTIAYDASTESVFGGNFYYQFDAGSVGDFDGLGRLGNTDESIPISPTSNISHSHTYAYNMRSELIEADITNINSSTWTTDYIYSNDGNVHEKDTNGGSDTFKYDADADTNDDCDLLTKIGSPVFLYWDENTVDNSTTTNGWLTTGPGGNQYEYNWDGKVRSGTNNASDVKLSFKYDPMGNRICRTVYDISGTPVVTEDHNYIIDIVGNLPVILCELDSVNSNVVTNEYYYADAQILCQYDNSSGTEKFYYVHDRIGSVRLIIHRDDGSQTIRVKNSYTYSPFGTTLEEYADTTAPVCRNPWQFTGQWYDSEINQYNLRARQYDPTMMRFTTRDPIRGEQEDPLSLHKYLYCWNNPINKADPSGKMGEAALLEGIVYSSEAKNQGIGAVCYWVETGDERFFEAGLELMEISAESFALTALNSMITYPISQALDPDGIGTAIEIWMFFLEYPVWSGPNSPFVDEVWGDAMDRTNIQISGQELNDYLDWLY